MKIINNLFLTLVLIFIPSQSIASYAQSDISSDGVVVTQHYLATEIGENILTQGGNAYDAAIAVGFALAVVLPRAGNIGGGGFMVIYDEDSNDTYAIDYREKAPAASFRDRHFKKIWISKIFRSVSISIFHCFRKQRYILVTIMFIRA